MWYGSLLVALLVQAPTAQQPTFAQVAAEHFASWDQDGDGKLTPREIDLLCVDGKLKGPPAAAVAALKFVVRSGRFTVPPLARDTLTVPQPKAAPKAKPAAPKEGSDTDTHADAPTTEPAAAATLPPPDLQAIYTRSLRKIAATKRDLFLDPTPDLDRCRQGQLGDCYFVASVGAYVQRNPADVQKLVKLESDGRYTIQFGDGRSIQVSPLTDAEIALSGTAGDEGIWLPVLEKALGELRQTENPQKFTAETATDAIAGGGSTATILQLLTGHQTQRIALKRRVRSTEKGPDGKPIARPAVLAGKPEELAAKVSQALTAAMSDKRLATCGTGIDKQPPGISGKHAYAILGFDAATNVVTLWNPHGNSFRPKGEPGLANGYVTKAGVFQLPLAEFVQIFQGIVFETATPMPPRKSPTPPAEKGK